MAKPRIFVSSTYFDLKHIRAVLDSFIRQFGYEAVLFEKGNIPFHHDTLLEQSCLAEVDTCDILILIIGGRYGSLSKEDQELKKKDPEKFFAGIRSVTRKEYERAREKDIPIFIFVEDGVLSEFRTFQQNRDIKGINYAHVDDRRIYEMLGDIYVQRTNNFVKGFSSHDDILSWLREQWAGLFADALKRRQTDTKLKSLEGQISELSNVVSALKSYSEEIVRTINKDQSTEIIAKVDLEFQKRQLGDFAREDLITHIVSYRSFERKGKTAPPALTDEEIYQAFLESTDLADFLRRVDYPANEIEEFSHYNFAMDDYEKMRQRYTPDSSLKASRNRRSKKS